MFRRTSCLRRCGGSEKVRLWDPSPTSGLHAPMLPASTSAPPAMALIGLEHLREKDPSTSLGLGSILSAVHASVPGSRERVIPFTFNVNTTSSAISSPSVASASDAGTKSPRAAALRFDPQLVYDAVMTHPVEFDFILLGAFVWNEPYIQFLQEAFNKRKTKKKNKIVIIGGPQVSYCEPFSLPRYYPNADFFLRGFAEAGVVAIAKGFPLDVKRGLIPGLASREVDLGKSAGLKDLRKLVPLDYCSPHLEGAVTPHRLILPSSHYSSSATLMPLQEENDHRKNDEVATHQPNNKFARWETVRGCPYHCTFCQHRDSNGGYDQLPTLRVERELGYFKAVGVTHLNVLDPTFNVNTKRVLPIIAQFWAGLNVSLQVRPEKITSEFVAACNASPANFVFELGVQSTNPIELAVIERHSSSLSEAEKLRTKVFDKIKMLNQLKGPNISFEMSLIYGLPRQTLSTFSQSMEECLALKPNKLDAFPLMLLRGTPMERDRQRLFSLPATTTRSTTSNPTNEGRGVGTRGAELKLVEGEVPPDAPLLPEHRVQDFIPHVLQTPWMSKADWYEMAKMASQVRGGSSSEVKE